MLAVVGKATHRALTLPRISSSFITLAQATPAAQLTAFPAYVPPMLPGGCLSASSLRVTIPESGKPYEQIQMLDRPQSRVKGYQNTYIRNALGHDHNIWLQTWRNGLNSEV